MPEGGGGGGGGGGRGSFLGDIGVEYSPQCIFY